jgi:hypothetical protein
LNIDTRYHQRIGDDEDDEYEENKLQLSPVGGSLNNKIHDDEGRASSAQKSAVSDRTPLLFVDVNLGGDASERIIVYEGDTARDLALKFCEEHNLDEDTL